MKGLKFLTVLVFPILVFASCEKKESEENKPEETASVITTVPRIDLIRKVIRYKESGGIQDSVLFKYDSQDRLIKIEYGNYLNGQSNNKIEYQYSINPAGVKIITENRFELSNGGFYEPHREISVITYKLDPLGRAEGISITGNHNFASRYSVSYDAQGLIDYTQTNDYKYGDYFLNLDYQVQNGNIVEIESDTEVFPDKYKIDIEYYPQPYNHNLFVTAYEGQMPGFWNYSLENLWDVRYNFLGKRNRNLIKRIHRVSGGVNVSDRTFQYEFNDNGLVSKIESGTPLPNGTTPLYSTKYEIFYF